MHLATSRVGGVAVQRGNVNVRGGSAGALGRGPSLHQPQLHQARPQPDKSARSSAGGDRLPLQGTPTPSSASGRSASDPSYGARSNEAATSSTAPRAPLAQPGIGGGLRHQNMFRAPMAHPSIGHSRVGSPGSRDNIAHHHHHHSTNAAASGKSNKSSPRGQQVTPKATSEVPQRLTPPTQRLSQDLRSSEWSGRDRTASDSAPNFESPEKTTPPSSGVRYHTASDPTLRNTNDSQLHSRASVNGTSRPHHLRCAGTPSGLYQQNAGAHHAPMHPTPSAPKARQPLAGGPSAGDADCRKERQPAVKGSGLMQSSSGHSPSHGSHQRGLAHNLQIPGIQSAILEKRYICISPLKDHCSVWLTRGELEGHLMRHRVSFERVNGGKSYLKRWDAKDAEQHGRQHPPPITEAQLAEIWDEAADTVDTQRRPDCEVSGGRSQQQQRAGGHENNTLQFTMSEEEKCKLLAHTISYFHKMIRNDPFHASLENYNEKDRQIRTETFEQFKEEGQQDTSASVVSEFIIQILRQGAYEVVNFVMGVYYMAKFKGATRVPLHSQTWRNLFITSLVISDKMWEDVPAKNSNVVKFFRQEVRGQEQGLDKKRLASMEHKFLEALDFRLSARTSETAGVGTEGILEQWDPWMADMRKTQINPEIEQQVNKYFGQNSQASHVNREPRSPSPSISLCPQSFRHRDNLGGLGKGRQLTYLNRPNDEIGKPSFYSKGDVDGEGASSRVEPSSSRTEPASSDRAASESRALLNKPQPGPTNPISTRSTLPSRTGPFPPGKGGHGPGGGARAANSRNPTSRVASRQQIPTAAPTPPKSASSTTAQGSSGHKSLHGGVGTGQPETFVDASRRGLTMNAGEGTTPGLGLGSINRSGRSSSPSSTGIVTSKDDRAERGRAMANGTSHTSTGASPAARGMVTEANGTHTSPGLQLQGGVRVSSSSTGAMNTARGAPTSAALNPHAVRGNSHGNLTAQPTVRGGAQVRASQGAHQTAGQGHTSARLQPPTSSYPFQPSGRASQSRAAPASMLRHHR